MPALAKRSFVAISPIPRRFLLGASSHTLLSTYVFINPTHHARTTPLSTFPARFKESSSTRPDSPKTSSSDKDPNATLSFSLKHMSPTVRYWFIGVFVVLSLVEGAAWVKFLPKIYNKESPTEEALGAPTVGEAVASEGK